MLGDGYHGNCPDLCPQCGSIVCLLLWAMGHQYSNIHVLTLHTHTHTHTHISHILADFKPSGRLSCFVFSGSTLSPLPHAVVLCKPLTVDKGSTRQNTNISFQELTYYQESRGETKKFTLNFSGVTLSVYRKESVI